MSLNVQQPLVLGPIAIYSYDVSVTRYDFSNGRLRISFQQPNHDLKQQAEVDITIVLETITRELLTVGSWISLIGYVLNDTKHSDYVEASDAPGKKRTRQPAKLQAVALWDAGQLRNAAPGGDYEASVHSRRTAMHLMAAARSQNRA